MRDVEVSNSGSERDVEASNSGSERDVEVSNFRGPGKGKGT